MSWTATLRGVTIGAGTQYRWIVMPVGLDVLNRQRLTPAARGGALALNADVPEAGTLTFEVHLLGTSSADVETLRDALAAAWAPSDDTEELTLTLASADRVYLGRPLSATFAFDRIATGALAAARLVYSVTDPRWYGATPEFAYLSVATPTGGFGETFGEPFGEGYAGGTADVTATNTGTAPAPWAMTLVATTAVSNPRITVGGATVELTAEIPAGSVVTVDSATRSVTLDGSPRAWATFASTWAELPPGSSTVSLRADSGDLSATFTWRPASY